MSLRGSKTANGTTSKITKRLQLTVQMTVSIRPEVLLINPTIGVHCGLTIRGQERTIYLFSDFLSVTSSSAALAAAENCGDTAPD